MRSPALRWPALIALIVACGCGHGRRSDPERKPAVTPRAPSVTFGGSVIRMKDPKGRWTFEARSAAVKGQPSEGSFTLSPADCTYGEKGKEPVRMRAASADVQKQAGRVTLRGSVAVTSDGWRLDADSVTYNLNTGKVVSPGRSKVTYSPEAGQRSQSLGGRGAQR